MISDAMIEWIQQHELERYEEWMNDESNWSEPVDEPSTTA
jgi:hypothetical protein